MNKIIRSAIILFVVVRPYEAFSFEHYAKFNVKRNVNETQSARNSSQTKNQNARTTLKKPMMNEPLGYDGSIVYPDKLPPPAANCTFGLCWKVHNYPTRTITTLLNRHGIADLDNNVDIRPVSFDNRLGDDEENLCPTQTHFVYPQKANNTNGVEKIIVNVDNHKQGIAFETCIQNKHCKFSEAFPSHYTSSCKQKYVIRRLMILNNDEELVYDMFEIPSCCVCIIKKKN